MLQMDIVASAFQGLVKSVQSSIDFVEVVEAHNHFISVVTKFAFLRNEVWL